MTEKRGMKAIDLGPTGEHVATAVREIRESRALSYQALSDALSALGWPIPELGLRRIEARARRVTVDDLLALAAALNVSPARLLVTPSGREAEFTGMPPGVADDEVWAWLTGRTNLSTEARLQYWSDILQERQDELDELARVAESDNPKARSWARRNMRVATQLRDRAATRIRELGGEADG